MRRTTLISLLCILLLSLAGCKHRAEKEPADGSTQDRYKRGTQIPELPYILEGDYTPDTGVVYKVILDGDTCFVVVDQITDKLMIGHYYPLVAGSDCVERRSFTKDRHWKEQRDDATVYLYEDPKYEANTDKRYRKPLYSVEKQSDIIYGSANGYWVSMPLSGTEGYGEILSTGVKNGIFKSKQTLTLDLYQPDNDEPQRPLILLLHGGGFYAGDKSDSAISSWCRHFASLGYVAVSANYRMGFLPTKNEITRTGYAALQDAHAAMRYLVSQAEEYHIDTSLLFVGGCSAGSITALNLAFMRDKDRPQAARGRRGGGAIAASGNELENTFHIKAVANMWGALTNLNMLKNSHTDIISFHGDADEVVPYDNGYPFADISKRLGERMFDRMYGSQQIDRRATELGYRSRFYPFPGQGHSLHHHADGSWNQENYEFIRDKMTDFFFDEIVGTPAVIEDDRNDNRHYLLACDAVDHVSWKVEGGFILHLTQKEIWVVWRSDAPVRKLRASGRYRNGIGFEVSHNE